MSQKNKKLHILKKYIKLHSDEAVQGSEKWLKDRQFIIGGSEIASIQGCNAFSSLERLVAQKVGLESFTGNTATRWGNLFENVSELLFKTIFIEDKLDKNDKIYATGSIQHKTISNHRYSPDGLCVLPFNQDSIKKNVLEKNYKITLLEFKSPSGTAPTAKVPKHYLPQVKAGLCTIDIAEIAVFANNMFRKCTLNQLDFSMNYDTGYHRDTELKLKGVNIAIANGIILFSISDTNIPIFNQKYNTLIEQIEQRNTHSDNNVSDYDSDEESFFPDEKIVTPKMLERMKFLSDYSDDSSDSDSESDNDSQESALKKNIVEENNIIYMIKKIVNILETSKESESENLKEVLKENMIDLGKEPREIFDQFLENYKKDNEPSFIDIQVIKPQINKEIMQMKSATNLVIPSELDYVRNPSYLKTICKKYNNDKIIDAFIDKCVQNKHVPIGYLPWKLLRSSNIIVEKEDDYLNNIKTKIDNTMNIVNDIMSNAISMDDRATKLEKYFPNNEISKNYYENKPHSVEFIRNLFL